MSWNRSVALLFAGALGACGVQPSGASNTSTAERSEIAPMASPSIAPAGSSEVADPMPENGQTIDRTNATGMTVLRDILVAVGQVDGKPISEARLQDRCHLALTSKDGVTVLDLKQIGNFAPRTDGERQVIELDDGLVPVELPAGRTAEDVASAEGGRLVDEGPFDSLEEAEDAIENLEAETEEEKRA